MKIGIIKKFFDFLRKTNWKKIIPFLIIALIFLINTFHEEYPDEYDSLVGGKYILEGKIPYKDWFQHHQPGAYLLAAFILPFSGQSFVRFRVFLALVFFLINFGGYILIKKRCKNFKLNFYLIFLLLLSISATYFWAQMLLADTLSAYFLIPTYALLLIKEFSGERLERKDLIIFSLFSFLTWFTSMTYTFVLLGLYLYVSWQYFTDEKKFNSFGAIIKNIFLIFGLPYLFFFLFFALVGGLDDWYFANIFYNGRYYIYNYPKPLGVPLNPLRYAVVIAHNFLSEFFPLLAGVKNFDFEQPFNITLGLSNVAILGLLILKRKYKFIFPFLITLIYSCSRANPFGVHETDYQASVYILFSFMNGFFALFALAQIIDDKKEVLSKKIVGSFLFLILLIYWSFNSYFVSLRFFQKFYLKYMGQAPLIYDRPEVTPFVNKLVKKDEYAWVGPFDFKELFYLNAEVPSKYHWFLDHASKIDKIKQEMIADFNRNKPAVIVFRRNYAPWGGDPKTFNYFFTDFLEENYFRIFELKDGHKYRWKIADTQHFDIDGDFYFDKSRKEEIIKKLIELGFLEEK